LCRDLIDAQLRLQFPKEKFYFPAHGVNGWHVGGCQLVCRNVAQVLLMALSYGFQMATSLKSI